jgi:ketosteroid isomerase-like protein
MSPDGPSYSGKAAFEEFYRSIFETFSVEGVWPVEGTEEIIVAGDWAFHLSEYILLITPNEGGETMEEKGKIVEIVQKQPDGSWKFAREIWNTTPPPEAE